MAKTRFAGPIQVGAENAPATAYAVREHTVAVTATANTDFAIALPKCRVTRITTVTTTAFGAATDATLQFGSTVGGADYVAAASVKAIGRVDHTILAAAFPALMNMAEGAVIRGRVVQTGAASAVGAAVVLVTLIQLA